MGAMFFGATAVIGGGGDVVLGRRKMHAIHRMWKVMPRTMMDVTDADTDGDVVLKQRTHGCVGNLEE